MNFEKIKEKIEEYKKEEKKIFVTSSFQTHSIPLLHIISKIDNTIPVVFNNTGFHFPETIHFKDQVCELLGLKVIETKSLIPKSEQLNSVGNLHYTSDPDYCCYLNKVQPLEPILMQNDIWINGVRADQSATRKAMKVEQKAPFNVTRFHPMLDWDNKMIFRYIGEHSLPSHPLEAQGYLSIGCAPCTRKFNLDEERDGRWFGMNKTECGLHTELIEK